MWPQREGKAVLINVTHRNIILGNKKKRVDHMKERLNVKEATYILSEEGITDSEQIVRRWIREGKLKAARTENRKKGYCIFADDLTEFILKRKPEKKWQRIADEDYLKWENALATISTSFMPKSLILQYFCRIKGKLIEFLGNLQIDNN